MKKSFKAITAFVFLFAAVTAFFLIVFTGRCGENVKWSYNPFTETLTVSGQGKMFDYDSEKSPSPIAERFGLNSQFEPETLIIKDGVTGIGDFAFFEMHCIEKLVLPEGLIRIGEDAFAYNDITSLDLPDSLMSIGEGAFRENSIKGKIVIPEGVTFLGRWAFYNCRYLNNVIIKGKITSLEENTFGLCHALSELHLPATVTEIKSAALSNCVSLTDIYFDGTDAQWNKIVINPEYNRHIIPNVKLHCK